MNNEYPRESVELVLFDEVTVNGEPATVFEYQLQRDTERPTGSWLIPVDVDGAKGFMLGAVPSRSTWTVWVRVVAQGGQSIVINAGEVERT